MDVLKMILQYVPLLVSILLSVFYFRANKRIKNNEATKGELDNLIKIIDQLEKDRDSLIERVEDLEKREIKYRQDALSKEMQIVDYESILIKYKRAMNYSCEEEGKTCPIKDKFQELTKNEGK